MQGIFALSKHTGNWREGKTALFLLVADCFGQLWALESSMLLAGDRRIKRKDLMDLLVFIFLQCIASNLTRPTQK